jgi:hypothetical protein
MATKLYFPSSGAGDVSRTKSTYWTGATTPVSHQMVKTKINSAYAFSAGAYTSQYDLNTDLQYCSQQFNAYNFTAADEIRLQISASMDTTSVGLVIAMSLRVVSADGATVRGILYEGYGDVQIAQTNCNRSIGIAGAHVHVQNSVSMQAGDRLILEIGCRGGATTNSYYTQLGDVTANSDCPADETSNTWGNNNGWMDLSPTLADYEVAANPLVKVINE